MARVRTCDRTPQRTNAPLAEYKPPLATPQTRAPQSGQTRSCGDWLATNADLDRLDAELLTAHVLGTGRTRVLAYPETKLTPTQANRLDVLARRRRQLEPLAYILGKKEFYGLNFSVDRTVLVPRPETELLVALALRLAPCGGRLVDLGTGSGCVAVAIKTHRPDLRIAATDRSCRALRVARANAVANGAEISFTQADWLAALRGPFDCIVANPPYVAHNDVALKTLRHEPRLALSARANGLAAIHQIVAQAPARLMPGACLILEHGCAQSGVVRKALARNHFHAIETHQDLAGLDRVTVARA